MTKEIIIIVLISLAYFYWINNQPTSAPQKEVIEMQEKKISDLETQLLSLAKQKLADKKEVLESHSLKAQEEKHQNQLRQIYALFDLRVHGMKEIEFSQLMEMLKGVKKKVKK